MSAAKPLPFEPRALVAAVLSVAAVAGALLRGPLPNKPAVAPEVVQGGIARPEGCLRCHADVQGLGAAHDPKALGCSACHLGDPTALGKAEAHTGMVLLTGDLRSVEQTCGRAGCHPTEAARVVSSLMAGAPGLLAVDRFAFEERPSPKGDDHDDLRGLDETRPPSSPAESHVRKLCASCHVGGRKTERGDQGFMSRGGGCTACHLGKPAGQGGGQLHPDVSAQVSEARCTGCHARSGRISLSYHGQVELEPPDPAIEGKLPDGRSFGRAEQDVHAAKGMVCIDCHVERELMGDGAKHLHSHQALHVQCADCHGPFAAAAQPEQDVERVEGVLREAWARGKPALPSGARLATHDGLPMWRTNAATRTLARAEDGKSLVIPATSTRAYHALPGHKRLTCQACHTQWAPRCPSCHTRYEPGGSQFDHLAGRETPGAWVEEPSPGRAATPALAIGPGGAIGPFLEGMTLRIQGPGAPIDRVLWAPLDAHTTGKARACPSCHAPSDTDVVYPAKGQTTREGARLFTDLERAAILAVGRCLQCHSSYDDAIYADFARSVTRLEAGELKKCRASGQKMKP